MRDLDAVVKDGTLNALMTFNSTSYFIYRGEPMGFEYELLKQFAEDHNLGFDVTVIRDRSELWPRLNRGEGDIAGARLFRTEADEMHVTFTRPFHTTRPTVVQRTGPVSRIELPAVAERAFDLEATGEQPPATVPAKRIASPNELAGRKLHLPNQSPMHEVFVELSDRLTGDIEVVEVQGVASVEPLIRRVVRGEIELTAAPQDVAELKEEYFQNISVQPAVGPPLGTVWAVRKNAPRLLEEINDWIGSNQETIDRLYAKYFEDRKGFRERVDDEYLSSETGRLSQYDELFREHAPKLGWDWRLLASQAYQESKFDPRARSWAGAMGLLQLMPGTAREVGVRQVLDPASNVEGGVRYLQKLEEQWRTEIANEDERLKFVLASYNAGRGHILDAQRLAEKHGQDPLVWKNVAFWLLQKSKRNVYTDPVVRHGFVRGLEPVMYVDLILDRFQHYQQFVDPGA